MHACSTMSSHGLQGEHWVGAGPQCECDTSCKAGCVSGTGVRMGTSPIEAWPYPMLTIWHEEVVQSSPCTDFGGVPGGPHCPGEHVTLQGHGGGQLPGVAPCGCNMLVATMLASWGTPSHLLPCSCRLDTRPGADGVGGGHWLVLLSGHIAAFPGARLSRGQLCCSSHTAAPASRPLHSLPGAWAVPVSSAPASLQPRGTWSWEQLLQEWGSHAEQGTRFPAQAPRNRALQELWEGEPLKGSHAVVGLERPQRIPFPPSSHGLISRK